MTALLFALVDWALMDEARGLQWERFCSNTETSMKYFRKTHQKFVSARQQVGWWRSLWPMGGGA